MTTTDTQWTDRLADIMPDNFMNNISDVFQDNTSKMLLDTMMNRIGLTVIEGVDNFQNKFAKYTGTIMDLGDTVQKYKVGVIKAEEYDPDNTNPFVPAKNKPKAQYATLDDSAQYHETINAYEFQKAFTSDQRLGDFVSAKLDSMYESDGLDKYIKWRKYLSDFAKFGAYRGVEADETDTDVYAGNLWDELRLLAQSKFKQPSSAYNVLGETTISPSVDIIMKNDDKLLVDKYLKGVYNLEKTNIDQNLILIDDFATPENIPEGVTDFGELVAIVADSRAFHYYPRTPQAGSIYNPKSLNMEYYLTVQGTYCADRFRNVVGIYKKSE